MGFGRISARHSPPLTYCHCQLLPPPLHSRSPAQLKVVFHVQRRTKALRRVQTCSNKNPKAIDFGMPPELLVLAGWWFERIPGAVGLLHARIECSENQ